MNILIVEDTPAAAKSIELRSLNSEHRDRTLPMSDIEWVARVMWASQ